MKKTEVIIFSIFILSLIIISWIQWYHSQFPPHSIITCESHLRDMGKALQAYAADNNGYFPSLTEEQVDYHYRGGLKNRDKGDIPIVWDKASNHKGGRFDVNVLYVNGNIEGFAESEWGNILKK